MRGRSRAGIRLRTRATVGWLTAGGAARISMVLRGDGEGSRVSGGPLVRGLVGAVMVLGGAAILLMGIVSILGAGVSDRLWDGALYGGLIPLGARLGWWPWRAPFPVSST